MNDDTTAYQELSRAADETKAFVKLATYAACVPEAKVIHVQIRTPLTSDESLKRWVEWIEETWQRTLTAYGYGAAVKCTLVEGESWDFSVLRSEDQPHTIDEKSPGYFLAATLPNRWVYHQRITRRVPVEISAEGFGGIPLLPSKPIARVSLLLKEGQPHLEVSDVSDGWRVDQDINVRGCCKVFVLTEKSVAHSNIKIHLTASPLSPDQGKAKQFPVYVEPEAGLRLNRIWAISSYEVENHGGREQFVKRYACATKPDRDALAEYLKVQNAKIGDLCSEVAIPGVVEIPTEPTIADYETAPVEGAPAGSRQIAVWPFEVALHTNTLTPATFDPPGEMCLYRLDKMAKLLDRLHAGKLAHGDVKPANVVEMLGGKCALIDWESLSGDGLDPTLLRTTPFVPPNEPADPKLQDLIHRDRYGFLAVCYAALHTSEATQEWSNLMAMAAQNAGQENKELRLFGQLAERIGDDRAGWCEWALGQIREWNAMPPDGEGNGADRWPGWLPEVCMEARKRQYIDEQVEYFLSDLRRPSRLWVSLVGRADKLDGLVRRYLLDRPEAERALKDELQRRRRIVFGVIAAIVMAVVLYGTFVH